jgi:hypothetical protein
MTDVQVWCRVTIVGPDGSQLSRRALEGPGNPDVGTVDELARLALLARRLGGGVVLADVSPTLGALLDLAGLRFEVKGQVEGGEEPLGV